MKKLLVSIVLFALVAGCAQSGAQPTLTPTPGATAEEAPAGGASAQGYVTPVRHADLAFRTGGRVAEILVKEGDQVKAGQPLVKLQDADLKAALAAAQADLARLQAGARLEEIAQATANLDVANGQVKVATVELNKVKTGAQSAADIASAQAQLAQAQVQLKQVRDAYDALTTGRELIQEYKAYHVRGHGLTERIEQVKVQLDAAQAAYDAAQKRLAQARAGGSSDLQSAQARLHVATAQRDAAQAQLNLTKAGATAEQIQAAQARVTQAQAALDEATLVAPFDGTLAGVNVNMGDMVSPGPRVASLADLSQWEVDTDDLSEVDVVNIQPGAEASIAVDALPGVTLKGRVTFIVPRSIVKGSAVTYTVQVAIADPDSRLKWGMTALVDIHATPTATPATTGNEAPASGASALGYVTPVYHADLAFRTGGRVAEILVKESDQVKAGQPLVKLQDTELKAVLAQAQADLKSLQNGARPEEIAAAQANLDMAQGQLEVAQANLSRLQNGTLAVQLASAQADAARAAANLKVAQDSYNALVTGHGIPTDANVPGRGLGQYEENKRAELAAIQATYDAALKKVTDAQVGVGDSLQSAQAGVDIATAQRDAAQAKLDLLKAGAMSQQIDAAKARVARAQAALDEATLVASFDGTIAELTINMGEMATPGVRIASIADLTQWEVETDDLSEVDVVTVQAGTDVSITVDALPGVILRGKVTSITPRSAVKRGAVTYTVQVAITDPDPRLKWGMTAFVDVRSK